MFGLKFVVALFILNFLVLTLILMVFLTLLLFLIFVIVLKGLMRLWVIHVFLTLILDNPFHFVNIISLMALSSPSKTNIIFITILPIRIISLLVLKKFVLMKTKFNLFAVLFRVVLIMTLTISVISCGTSRASVRVNNRAENTQTDISVTTGNGGSTTVTVSPRVQMDSLSFKFNSKSN